MVLINFFNTTAAFFSLQPVNNELLIVFDLYLKLDMLYMLDIPFSVYAPHMCFNLAKRVTQRIKLFTNLIFNSDV